MRKVCLAIAVVLTLSFTASFVQAAPGLDDAVREYRVKNYEEAARMLRAYVRDNPDPSAYYLLGYALYNLDRFAEAEESFKDAYLLNPKLDPQAVLRKYGMLKGHYVWTKPEPSAEPPAKPAQPAPAKPVTPAVPPAQPAPAKPVTQAVPPAQPAPAKPVTQAAPPAQPAPAKPVTPAAPPAQPAPAKPVTPAAPPAQPTPPPPAAIPVPPAQPGQPFMPPGQQPDIKIDVKTGKDMIPPDVAGIIAALGIVAFVLPLVLWLYMALCIFLIARRLDVSAPWLVFLPIPIVNMWPFVGAAGKPWWWIILLLIPGVNLFVGIYLWMCLAENAGRSKIFGLLTCLGFIILLIPGLIMLGMMAFSGGGGGGGKKKAAEDMFEEEPGFEEPPMPPGFEDKEPPA